MTSSLEEAELRAFLDSRLARFEIPRYFHFVSTPLPRIAAGKIFKRGIREEAVARIARSRSRGSREAS